MFTDFTATERWTKKPVHCVYQAMIVAIATRHADAVDIKFLVDGRKVWVALPHPAWVEYKKRTGNAITDSLAQEIAGHYLKTALETRRGGGRNAGPARLRRQDFLSCLVSPDAMPSTREHGDPCQGITLSQFR
jgi:hypothetical protein